MNDDIKATEAKDSKRKELPTKLSAELEAIWGECRKEMDASMFKFGEYIRHYA